MTIVTTKFNMTKDVAGYNGFGIEPSDVKDGVLLAQNVAQTLTSAPTDYDHYLAIFSYTPGANVFVDLTGATAAPFSVTAGSVTAELNPMARSIKAGTPISVITPDATGAFVGVVFYVPPPFRN